MDQGKPQNNNVTPPNTDRSEGARLDNNPEKALETHSTLVFKLQKLDLQTQGRKPCGR